MGNSSSSIKRVPAGFKIIYEETNTPYSDDFFTADIINWQPPFDLYMIDDKIIINVELPGVEVKDISIYVGRYFVVVSGIKRNPIYELKKDKISRDSIIFHNFEISYGRFERRIEVPMPIEMKQGNYSLENGVLIIKFPVEKERIIPIEGE